jgi:hypothetical protein
MRGRASHVAFLLIVIALPSFAAPEEMVEAIWYPRSFAFDYRSQDVYYSCDELARKVRAILEFLGARRTAIESACPDRPSRFIRLRIFVVAPAPATPGNVRAVTTFDTKDELVARLHGITLPTPADVERFPAAWQTRRLSRIRGIRFEKGDCDMLNRLHEQVLSKLSVQLESKRGCDVRVSTLHTTMQYRALVRKTAPVS